MKNYYFLIIVAGVAIFLGATYYKLSPPIYIIQQYNLSYEKKSINKLTNKEVEIFDSLLQARDINYRSAEADNIYDSLLNQRLISGENQLLELSDVEYFKKTKKDSIIIVKKSNGIEFIQSVFNARSTMDIPEKFQKHLSDNTYNVVLYFSEKDLPIDIPGYEIKEGRRYFITTEDYKYYLTLTKVNELYTAEKLIDKGYLNDSTKIAIPEDILYPYKDKRFWILTIILLLALIPLYSTLKSTEDIDNLNRLSGLSEVVERQIKTAKIWLSLAIFGVLVASGVFFFGIDISIGGGVILVAGIFFAIVGIILFFNYRKQAILLSQILTGEGVLAKWEFDVYFWESFANKYLQRYLSMNKSSLVFISAILIIIFGIIMIIDPEVAKIMGLIGLGLIIFFSIFAFFVPRISAKNLKKSPPIAIIAKNGILVGKQFHSWGMFGNRFESSRIVEDEINIMEVNYSYRARSGRSIITILVPIPKGKLEEAQEIARKLTEVNK